MMYCMMILTWAADLEPVKTNGHTQEQMNRACNDLPWHKWQRVCWALNGGSER